MICKNTFVDYPTTQVRKERVHTYRTLTSATPSLESFSNENTNRLSEVQCKLTHFLSSSENSSSVRNTRTQKFKQLLHYIFFSNRSSSVLGKQNVHNSQTLGSVSFCEKHAIDINYSENVNKQLNFESHLDDQTCSKRFYFNEQSGSDRYSLKCDSDTDSSTYFGDSASETCSSASNSLYKQTDLTSLCMFNQNKIQTDWSSIDPMDNDKIVCADFEKNFNILKELLNNTKDNGIDQQIVHKEHISHLEKIWKNINEESSEDPSLLLLRLEFLLTDLQTAIRKYSDTVSTNSVNEAFFDKIKIELQGFGVLV